MKDERMRQASTLTRIFLPQLLLCFSWFFILSTPGEPPSLQKTENRARLKDGVRAKADLCPDKSLLSEDLVTDIAYQSPFACLSPEYLLYKIPDGKFIFVDVSVQRLWCCEDGKIIAYFVISTGKENRPTPTGDYLIDFKIKYAISRYYYEEGETRWWGLPYYLDIGGFGFHAVPSLYMKEAEPIETLGIPASHRCIRLGNVKLASVGGKSPARWLYDWADEGTLVRICGEWNFEMSPYPNELSYREFSEEKGFYLDHRDDGERDKLNQEVKVAG